MHLHVVSDSSGRTLRPPSFGPGFRVCPWRVIGHHETERRGRAAAGRRRPCRLSDVCCRRQLRRFRSRWPARAIASRSRGASGARWGSPDGRRAGPVVVCRVEHASPIQGGDHLPHGLRHAFVTLSLDGGASLDVNTGYAIRELGRNGDRVFARRHDTYQQGVIEQAPVAELYGVKAAIASVTRRSYSEV
jgi:hypothetical protein